MGCEDVMKESGNKISNVISKFNKHRKLNNSTKDST